MPSVSTALAEVLADYRRRLDDGLGPRVVEVRLFGSHARGEARSGSDVDVVVVLDDLRSHADRCFPAEVAGELLVERGVVVCPLVLSVAELDHLRRREDQLVANLDREGIVL
ncbi:MAG: nucleotidyltransferase domain-containing protein [Polyangiaceae bacterium]|nr:nucleotidyltransferase domain-containing protein [Polyangiaceae bacterium]